MESLPFAVFVPPPVVHFTEQPAPSGQPWTPPTRQDYVGFSVILGLSLAAALFVKLIDRN